MTFHALPALLLPPLLAARPTAAPPQQLAAAGTACHMVDAPSIGSHINRTQCVSDISQEERDAVARDISLRGNPKPIFQAPINGSRY